MIATIVNALGILLGGVIGLLGSGRLTERHTDTIVQGLAIVLLVLGVTPAVATNDTLAVIICLVLGTVLGQLLHIEARMDRLGDWLRSRFSRGDSRGSFTEGFVTSSLLMCVGSMAVMGSLEAGINHDYAIILSKAVIDSIIAVVLTATMGVGVAFAALPVFCYQGILTLLASVLAPYLSEAVVTEMSAVGGILLIGTGLNMLKVLPSRVQVGNMLPSLLLPIVYLPVADWITSLF